MKRLLLLFVPLLVLAAACGEDDDPGSGATPGAGHNDADVTFAQAMIPHHEQAIAMASMAADRSTTAEVVGLADAIEAAQQPEIDTLQGWLEDWDEPLEDSGGMRHGGSDMGMMGEDDMGMMGEEDMGMMGEEDMAMLESAHGSMFDRAFLEMMIEHHQGAIDMAEREIEDGQFPDAKAMAEEIKATQAAEVDEMQQLLQRL